MSEQGKYQKNTPGGGNSKWRCKPSVMFWTPAVGLASHVTKRSKIQVSRGFPGGAVVESLPANAGDAGSSPGLGGSHMPRSN